MIYHTILLRLQQITGLERSVSAIYYILKGNRSIQTIQDTHLFQVEPYFGIYRTLSKERFMLSVQEIVSEGFLEKKSIENHYMVTEKGNAWLRAQKDTVQLPHLNGLKWGQTADVFYKRILLLTQVWTNAQMQHTAYIPIVEDRDVEQWVKEIYSSSKHQVTASLIQLHKELSSRLKLLSEEQAAVWVLQLTGYQSIGMTLLQLADTYEMAEEDMHLITMHVNHFLLEEITNRPAEFPLLAHLALVDQINPILTASASKTKELIREFPSLEAIANTRGLKLNTIYDHIVEITLQDPSFSLTPYVDEQEEKMIMQAIQLADSFRLKDIKGRLAETITYFQIRLVLAKVTER